MNIVTTRIFHLIQIITSFFYLNLLWLLFCIPIITIFPATAAMFGVVRNWIIHKDVGGTRKFFSLFKQYFKQGMIIEIIWLLISLILLVDFDLLSQIHSSIRIPMYLLAIFASFMLLFTSIILFPTMVHFHHQKTWGLMKNTILLSISQFGSIILCILVISILGIIVKEIPFILLFVGSLAAYIIFYICNRSFNKIESVNNESKLNSSL